MCKCYRLCGGDCVLLIIIIPELKPFGTETNHFHVYIFWLDTEEMLNEAGENVDVEDNGE